jgi:hypothetical protein
MPDQETIDRIQAAQRLVEERGAQLARNQLAGEQLKEAVGMFRTKLQAKGIEPSQLDELVAAREAELEMKLLELEAKLSG